MVKFLVAILAFFCCCGGGGKKPITHIASMTYVPYGIVTVTSCDDAPLTAYVDKALTLPLDPATGTLMADDKGVYNLYTSNRCIAIVPPMQATDDGNGNLTVQLPARPAWMPPTKRITVWTPLPHD